MELTDQDIDRLGQIITNLYHNSITNKNRIKAINSIVYFIAVLCLINLFIFVLLTINIMTTDIKAELDDYFDNPTEVAQLVENFEIYED